MKQRTQRFALVLILYKTSPSVFKSGNTYESIRNHRYSLIINNIRYVNEATSGYESLQILFRAEYKMFLSFYLWKDKLFYNDRLKNGEEEEVTDLGSIDRSSRPVGFCTLFLWRLFPL